MPLTPEVWLPATTFSNGYLFLSPKITQLTNGNFVVVGYDNTDTGVASPNGDDIVGQIFNPLGVAIGSTFLVNHSYIGDDEHRPDIVARPNGGFITVYEDFDAATGEGSIRLVERDSLGNYVSSNETVATSAGTNYGSPVVESASGTSFLVAYRDSSSRNLEGTIYNPTTNSYGPNLTLITGGIYSPSTPSITVLNNGNYVVTAANYSGGEFGIAYRIVDSNGANVKSDTYINGTDTNSLDDIYCKVTALSGGGFVITWQVDAGLKSVKFQTFDSSGNSVGPIKILAPLDPANSMSSPNVTGLDDGGFVLTFNEVTPVAYEHYLQRFDASGNNVGTRTQFDINASVNDISTLEDGRIVIAGYHKTVIYDTRDNANSTPVYNGDWQIGTVGDDVFTANITTKIIHGWDGNDTITEDTTSNLASDHYGDDGDDVIIVKTSIGNDRFYGGAGTDEISWINVAQIGGVYDLKLGTATSALGVFTETMLGFENFVGTNNADTIRGSDGDNELRGEGGNDLISGRLGADTLFGGDGNDTLYAMTANDLEGDTSDNTLHGNIGNDTLHGSAGNDTLHGNNGADTLYGRMGNDTLFGGFGNDKLKGQNGNDTLYGDDGNDTLFGGSGADSLYGDAGSDTLSGDKGLDYLSGGAGDDTLIINYGDINQGAETFDGGADSDTLLLQGGATDLTQDMSANTLLGLEKIEFGAGDVDLDRTLKFRVGQLDSLGISGLTIKGLDLAGNTETLTLVMDTATADLSALTFTNWGNQNELVRIEGDADDETITGTARKDLITGQEGDDTLSGGNGDDTLKGQNGADVLNGQSGDDTLYGGSGADILNGNGNNDTLYGGVGQDELYGGNGDDTLVLEYGDDEYGAEIFDGGAGTDKLLLTGGNIVANNFFSGDALANLEQLEFGAGTTDINRTVFLQDVHFGAAELSLTAEIIGLDVANNTEKLIVYLTGTTSIDLSGLTFTNWGGQNEVVSILGNSSADTITGTDQFDQILSGAGTDTVNGGAGDDIINGEDDADVLHGDEGDDTIDGGQGSDQIYGDDGVDTLNGGDNNDSMFGGTGNDILNGDAGVDVLWGEDDDDTLHGGADNDTLHGGQGADILYGDDGDDTLNGNYHADDIYGGAGDDTLTGGAGFDALFGDDGDDTLFGDAAADNLWGLNGADILNGGIGDDILYGGAQQDILDGGGDNDTLHGGGDTDTFVFTDGFGADTILDFAATNAEKIDLSGVAAITDFADLVANHLTTDASTGFAMIQDGVNTILLNGYTVADIGTGLAISDLDFIF